MGTRTFKEGCLVFPLEEEVLGKWGTGMGEGSLCLTRDCRPLPHHPAPSGDRHEIVGLDSGSEALLLYNVTII